MDSQNKSMGTRFPDTIPATLSISLSYKILEILEIINVPKGALTDAEKLVII
jgi:hypothetical protein